MHFILHLGPKTKFIEDILRAFYKIKSWTFSDFLVKVTRRPILPGAWKCPLKCKKTVKHILFYL